MRAGIKQICPGAEATQLITWNIQWFCGLDDVVRVERIVDEALAMADFDVLCLQQVAVR